VGSHHGSHRRRRRPRRSRLTAQATPVTHHFRHVDPDTGHLIGAIPDLQAARVRQLVEAAGNTFTYRSFPEMPHSMHENDPGTYAATVTEWLSGLSDAAAS
jgi:hypothetical protein